MYITYGLGLLIFCAWIEMGISEPAGRACYHAKICIHNAVEKCGIDSKGAVRRFLDTCDMKEYNCLKGTDFSKTSQDKCDSEPMIKAENDKRKETLGQEESERAVDNTAPLKKPENPRTIINIKFNQQAGTDFQDETQEVDGNDDDDGGDDDGNDGGDDDGNDGGDDDGNDGRDDGGDDNGGDNVGNDDGDDGGDDGGDVDGDNDDKDNNEKMEEEGEKGEIAVGDNDYDGEQAEKGLDKNYDGDEHAERQVGDRDDDEKPNRAVNDKDGNANRAVDDDEDNGNEQLNRGVNNSDGDDEQADRTYRNQEEDMDNQRVIMIKNDNNGDQLNRDAGLVEEEDENKLSKTIDENSVQDENDRRRKNKN